MANYNKVSDKWYIRQNEDEDYVANNNLAYGPWTTKATAVQAVLTACGNASANIPIGWTCGVIESGELKEYWIKTVVGAGKTAAQISTMLVEKGGSSVAGGLRVEDASGNDITSQVTVIISD